MNTIGNDSGKPPEQTGATSVALSMTPVVEQPPSAQNNNNSMVVGGSTAQPALCLLDGYREEADNVIERVTVHIQRLPTTVGRAHTTDDVHFIGLGGNDTPVAKAVSRMHIRIDYRVALPSTGKCGYLKTKDTSSAPSSDFVYCDTDPISVTDILVPPCASNNVIYGSADTLATTTTLPKNGFYTLTVVGRNRVMVDGHRVEPGQMALLSRLSTVRVANFCFYFVLPAAPPLQPRTLSICDDDNEPTSSNNNPNAAIAGAAVLPAAKKRKLSLSVSTAVPAVAGSGFGPTGVFSNGRRLGGVVKTTLQSEIEELSTNELLDQMTAALDEQVWDRRHQLIGSTISYRAVLVAAQDPALYQVAMAAQGQLSRTEIMDWIAESPMFRNWVEQMQSKMEAKSYQASITKALMKAGFKRTASTGRYIKWHLPDSLLNQNNRASASNTASQRSIASNGPTPSAQQEGDRNDSQDEEMNDHDDEMGDHDEKDNDEDDEEDDGDDRENESANSANGLMSDEVLP
jgi:hypothetical protein